MDASRYAVTTQERCSRPPRSPTIVGSAVATIVWSSDASRTTSRSALKIRRTRGAFSSSTIPHSYHQGHESNREDRIGVARGVDARAVPRSPRERHGAALHGRVRPRLRRRDVCLRRLRRNVASSPRRSTTPAAAGPRSTHRRAVARSTRRRTRATGWCAPRSCVRTAAATSATCSRTGRSPTGYSLLHQLGVAEARGEVRWPRRNAGAISLTSNRGTGRGQGRRLRRRSRVGRGSCPSRTRASRAWPRSADRGGRR